MAVARHPLARLALTRSPVARSPVAPGVHPGLRARLRRGLITREANAMHGTPHSRARFHAKCANLSDFKSLPGVTRDAADARPGRPPRYPVRLTCPRRRRVVPLRRPWRRKRRQSRRRGRTFQQRPVSESRYVMRNFHVMGYNYRYAEIGAEWGGSHVIKVGSSQVQTWKTLNPSSPT